MFNEEQPVASAVLYPVRSSGAGALVRNENLGRLKITNTMGDTDGDGDLDNLYSFGTRSFTIRDGSSGRIVFESGSRLENFLRDKSLSSYDDSRSDDKGTEPESVAAEKWGRGHLRSLPSSVAMPL